MPIHRNPIHTSRSDPLGFRDLYETLLNKLCSSSHRIGVDLYAWNKVRIAPVIGSSGHQDCRDGRAGGPVLDRAGQALAFGLRTGRNQRRQESQGRG